jgi:serine phosphatase RsbU (regulator of sigma subunit)
MCLGVTPETSYKTIEIALSPGESVLFCTDGVIEACNDNKEFLGNGRLADFLTKSKGPPRGKGLLEFVRRWQGNTPANDDITILEIWREKEDT